MIWKNPDQGMYVFAMKQASALNMDKFWGMLLKASLLLHYHANLLLVSFQVKNIKSEILFLLDNNVS